MKWSTLSNHLLKLQPGKTKTGDIYAVVEGPDGGYHRIYLAMKLDAAGCPYLVKDEAAQERYDKMRQAKFGNP